MTDDHTDHQPDTDHFESQPTSTPERTEDPSLSAQVAEALSHAETAARAAGVLPAKWDVIDYAATDNTTSGAKKLSDSAIAPLVAMARGYETIHLEDLSDAYTRYALPRKVTTQGKRLVDSLNRGDALIMPWYIHDDIDVATRGGDLSRLKPATIQYRPARPDVNEHGKEIKYEFVNGNKTPVGTHPGFPVGWFEGTPNVLIAEGLLKGDSALTGYLLANGATRDELSWTAEHNSLSNRVANIAAARSKLRELLDRIDYADRVLIMTIGGVYNWRANAEWRSIELNNRNCWIGVDGDVTSNPNVHRATTELWEFVTSRKSTPMLLSPTLATGDDEKKIGIDDYLADHGDWDGLLAMIRSELPSAPKGNDIEFIGTHRMSEDGLSLEFCKPVPDPDNPEGPPGRGRWEVEYDLGGRIMSMVASRAPSNEEIATGVIDKNDQTATHEVEIELKWRDHNDPDKTVTTIVSGSSKILNYAPDQWDRHGAIMSPELLCSPAWPPPKKISEEWMRALKGSRSDEIARRVRWETMGWVPVEGAAPVFLVGDQAIGIDDAKVVDVFPGVTEAELAGASRFGVGDEDTRSFEDADYRASVRRDIEAVIAAFIDAGAWTDRRVASTVLAASLRPAMPMRPAATIFCVGPPGGGKSLTASLMMGFWSRNPGDFTNTSLPGSVKDTPAAMELAVARSPIWVVDDLAPASSRQQSEQEQNRIADLVRNIFNGTIKRRSNADMGARKVFPPRALLVVTAENELQVPSARSRCITLNIGTGALSLDRGPTDELQSLCVSDGAPARVAQALIRYIRQQAIEDANGWAGFYEGLKMTQEGRQDEAAKRIEALTNSKGAAKRHSDMAGDLTVSLLVLSSLALEVGMSQEVADRLCGELSNDIVELVTMGYERSVEATPGRALIEAIAGTLFRKHAHIINAHTPGKPPGTEATAVNLGWEVGSDGTSRPKGDSIGWYVVDEVHGEMIYLNQRAAFAIAQRGYPDLVAFGQGSQSSWGSVIGEDLVVRELLRPGSNGKRMTTGRASKTLPQPVSGTPIALPLLLVSGDKITLAADQLQA